MVGGQSVPEERGRDRSCPPTHTRAEGGGVKASSVLGRRLRIVGTAGCGAVMFVAGILFFLSGKCQREPKFTNWGRHPNDKRKQELTVLVFLEEITQREDVLDTERRWDAPRAPSPL